MPIIVKSNIALTQDTISQLIDTSIEKNNSKSKLVKDGPANETLKEINQTMKTIKEQNDEIIGETF